MKGEEDRVVRHYHLGGMEEKEWHKYAWGNDPPRKDTGLG